jgi:hypothetical protein
MLQHTNKLPFAKLLKPYIVHYLQKATCGDDCKLFKKKIMQEK